MTLPSARRMKGQHMKNTTLSRPEPRSRSYERRESPRRFTLVDCNYQSSDDSSPGNTCSQKEVDDRTKRRSIRDISGELSEREKRWSFLIELFLFAVIVAIIIGPFLDMTRALSLLGN